MSTELPLEGGFHPSASRRTFLAGAGVGLTGLAAGAELAAAPDAEARGRTYTGGRFALDLDGVTAGTPARAIGADLYGEVVAQDTGTAIRSKHLANIKYNDISIVCGTAMSKTFYAALGTFSTGGSGSHDGVITRRDDFNKVFDNTAFYDARITGLQLPALDAGSKDAAKLLVTMQPDRVRFGTTTTAAAHTPPQRPAWTVGEFRLTLDGIDTSHVVRVGAMTLKQTYTPPDSLNEPGKLGALECSDLVITVADNNPADLNAWFKSFIIDGNRDEKAGTLVYLDATRKALFSLRMSNLGIYRMSRGTSIVGAETEVRTSVTMYCESAFFGVSAAAPL